MLRDLDSGEEIARRTSRLLNDAAAFGRFPTPVEDIIAAADLKEDEDALFDASFLAKASPALREKVRRLQSRVSAALDRKERVIYIDDGGDLDGKRRFKRLHEVTHDILPWQQDTAYADSNLTLSWATRAGFEQEANQGGAELLFQRQRFEEMASDYTIGFGAIFELADLFGASYHAAFRRYVETHRHQLAGVVLQRSPCEPGGVAYRRKEATNSESWGEKYDAACNWPSVLRAVPYQFVEKISVLVDDPLPLTFSYPNLNHEHETLHAELWSNSYNVFALIWAPRRERLRRRRIVRSGVAER